MENLKTLFNNIKENKPLFVSLIIIGIICVVTFILFSYFSTTNPDKVYHDPLSGETIYDPANQTPEAVNEPEKPNYLGFTSLVDRGISFDNIQSFKDQLAPISVKGEKATEISVDINSINHDIDTENDIYTFRIRINRKYDYQTTLKVKKSDDTFTFSFSGANVDKISFH